MYSTRIRKLEGKNLVYSQVILFFFIFRNEVELNLFRRERELCFTPRKSIQVEPTCTYVRARIRPPVAFPSLVSDLQLVIQVLVQYKYMYILNPLTRGIALVQLLFVLRIILSPPSYITYCMYCIVLYCNS